MRNPPPSEDPYVSEFLHYAMSWAFLLILSAQPLANFCSPGRYLEPAMSALIGAIIMSGKLIDPLTERFGPLIEHVV